MRERLRQLSEIIQEKFLRWRESGSKEDGAAVTEVLKWRDAIQVEEPFVQHTPAVVAPIFDR
jgi:hypothetical protein